MEQQIDDRRHADGERDRHARGQKAKENDQDDDDFETGAHAVSSLTSRTTARPSTINSKVAPTTIAVSGIQSGVARTVGAWASRRYELITNCRKYQSVKAM